MHVERRVLQLPSDPLEVANWVTSDPSRNWGATSTRGGSFVRQGLFEVAVWRKQLSDASVLTALRKVADA